MRWRRLKDVVLRFVPLGVQERMKKRRTASTLPVILQ